MNRITGEELLKNQVSIIINLIINYSIGNHYTRLIHYTDPLYEYTILIHYTHTIYPKHILIHWTENKNESGCTRASMAQHATNYTSAQPNRCRHEGSEEEADTQTAPTIQCLNEGLQKYLYMYVGVHGPWQPPALRLQTQTNCNGQCSDRTVSR